MLNKVFIVAGLVFLNTACIHLPATPIPSYPYQAGQSVVETYPNMLRSNHIVVVMQENRAFDCYFLKLPEFGQPDVNVAPPNTYHLDQTGKTIFLTLAETPCLSDEPHYWNKVDEQIAGGAMNGFAAAG